MRKGSKAASAPKISGAGMKLVGGARRVGCGPTSSSCGGGRRGCWRGGGGVGGAGASPGGGGGGRGPLGPGCCGCPGPGGGGGGGGRPRRCTCRGGGEPARAPRALRSRWRRSCRATAMR